MLEIVDKSELSGRNPERICSRCKKTVKEILEERPNLKKVFWRKGICDPCFHKLKRKCRNKEVEKDSNFGKGFRVEQTIAKALGIKNCNIELDDFNAVFDLYDPVKYKDIQVRSGKRKILPRSWKNKDGSKSTIDYIGWYIPTDLPECDNLFAVCMNEDYSDIEEIVIIPVNRLSMSQAVCIYECSTQTGNSVKTQYEDCKLDKNGELFNKIRDTYHSMKIDDCPIIKNNI